MTPATPPVRGPVDASPGLSIGRLADATGVGVETLRAWERRYGRPSPSRRASGHRRYGPDEVAWVRLVAAAVGAGARPSEVVDLPLAELGAYGRTEPPPPADWLRRVRDLDARGFGRAVERAAASAPDAATFLDRTLSPFLALLGSQWAEGRLAIRHEHFATEVLAGVLARRAARTPVRGRAPSVLLATLPGERHVLGLASASWVAAEAGVRPRSLGPDVPPEEIAAAAAESAAAAVAIAVSGAHAGSRSRRGLLALRAALPRAVTLVVGGAGVAGPRRWPPGILRCGSFAAFAEVLRGLRGPPAAARR